MTKEIINYRLKRFLEAERQRDFQSVEFTEGNFTAAFKTQRAQYKLQGITDRLDKTAQGYVLIDYKTGNVKSPVLSEKFNFEFNRTGIKKNIKSFQLIIYKYVLENSTKYNLSNAFFYKVQDSKTIPLFKNTDKSEQDLRYNKCLEALRCILDEINSDKPFEHFAKDKPKCEDCKYFYICR